MTKKQTSGKGLIFIWIFLVCALVATIAISSATGINTFFSFKNKVFFYNWYGFVACIIIVLVARFLGFFLKRHESYYKEGRND